MRHPSRSAWLALTLLCAHGCSEDSRPNATQDDAGPDAAVSGSAAGSVAGQSGSAGHATWGGHGGGDSSAGTSGRAGAGATGGAKPKLGSCDAFPADDVWNRDISGAAVSAEWTTHLHTLVGAKKLHPDYGNSGSEHYGIPINRVPATQPQVAVHFDDYPQESDPGPYPIPSPDATRIEGGTPSSCDGDCHLLVVQEGACRLYEGYACSSQSDGWHCSNGAVWDLTRPSEGQRKVGFTSADAAGLAIAPGLVRYDEAVSGAILHAIRFTLHCTRDNFVDPATHAAVPGGCASQLADAPPMGLRVRLKADYDTSKLTGAAKAVATAMQHYGMILADNGSDFYFQGEDDPRWNEADVEPLKTIPADAFEALEPGPLKR